MEVESFPSSLRDSVSPLEPVVLHDIPAWNDEKYHQLQRLVTPHPLARDSVAIETSLESFLDTKGRARYRVVVRCGPDSESDDVHASFELPVSSEPPASNAMAWAPFEEDPDHPLLCVLISPKTLTLFDVYPESKFMTGGEGWSVPIPFDASAVFPNGSREGVLLQRQIENEEMPFEDGTFVLHAPPQLPRLDDWSPIPSVFSLSHPLDEIRPVATHLNQRMSDVSEQIIWTGTSRWYQSERTQQATLVVTYHLQRQRHSVWIVETMSESSDGNVPLYQQTRSMLSPEAFKGHDLWEDRDILRGEIETANQAPWSRDDALADALGVRKTPRASVDGARKARYKNGPVLDHGVSFLSPTNQSMGTHETGHRSDLTFIHGPFSHLHSKVSMRCIYQEKGISAAAVRVFLASNAAAMGTLLLCLLCPGSGRAMQLRKLLLNPNGTESLEVNGLTALDCLSAAPITSTPVPFCFRPRGSFADWKRDARDATDIVVVDATSVGLYRADILTGLHLPVDRIQTVDDPIGDRVSVVHEGGLRRRLRISLRSEGSLSERCLDAIDASLMNGKQSMIQLALTIRAACCHQYLLVVDSGEAVHLEDASWSAFSSITLAFVEAALGLRTPSDKPTDTGEDAWMSVRTSEFCVDYHLRNGDTGLMNYSASSSEGPCRSADVPMFRDFAMRSQDALSLVFDSLHCVYEELKACGRQKQRSMVYLGRLLASVCQLAIARQRQIASAYLQHYTRDVGYDHIPVFDGVDVISPMQGHLSSIRNPPSFFSWVEEKWLGRTERTNAVESSVTNDSCTQLRSLLHIIETHFNGRGIEDIGALLSSLVEEGISRPLLLRGCLPLSVILPIATAIETYRTSAGMLGPESRRICELLNREDLCAGAEDVDITVVGHSDDSRTEKEYLDEELADDDSRHDGLRELEFQFTLLFDDVKRLRDVSSMLSSSRLMPLQVDRPVGTSDHEFEKAKQASLLRLCRRNIALCVGRGAATIGQYTMATEDTMPIPSICLKGRVPPTNAVLALDTSETPADLTVWPEFHNGVAAGLRLPSCSESTNRVSRSWIVFNRPLPGAPLSDEDANRSVADLPSGTHAHGGLLLGLGLRGHLCALEMTDVFDYLTQGAVTVSIGVLLGMSANKRSSCDMAISKMLCLHIPSLIPQHFSAIDVASPVQTAAIAGIGFLYQRSSHRMMTEFLLEEIGTRPASDANARDREAYTLACGLALGMVNLCICDDSNAERVSGIVDLRVEERLYRYVVGGIDDDEARRTREASDRFSAPSATSGSDRDKCATIYEGESINTNVTSPGATLALGLMYMKSENQSIADSIALPQTHFLLELVRPDFLSLRILARSLILWNSTKPTDSWFEQQIPGVISAAYKQMTLRAQDVVAGRSPTDPQNLDYDVRAVRQIYAHTVSGACFALSLRYAGTGNSDARRLIMERINDFKKLRESRDAVSMAVRPEPTILDSCISLMAVSLGILLAGHGDLEALGVLKTLLEKCDDEVTYGSHMAIGTATGLLFLGGGTCTLGRSADDIAAMVAAFYPRLPTTSTDNEQHSQAMRHLYAMAVYRREVRSIDVDTRQLVSVSADFVLSESDEVMSAKLPCLVRNSDQHFRELRVKSNDYYPVHVDLSKGLPRVVLVKKRGRSLRLRSSGHHDAVDAYSATFGKYIATYEPLSLLERGFVGDTTESNESALMLYCALKELSVSVVKHLATPALWDMRLLRVLLQNSAVLLHRDVICGIEESTLWSLSSLADDKMWVGQSFFHPTDL